MEFNRDGEPQFDSACSRRDYHKQQEITTLRATIDRLTAELAAARERYEMLQCKYQIDVGALERELAGAKRDTARLDWLDSGVVGSLPDHKSPPWRLSLIWYTKSGDLRAAINTARGE